MSQITEFSLPMTPIRNVSKLWLIAHTLQTKENQAARSLFRNEVITLPDRTHKTWKYGTKQDKTRTKHAATL